MDPVSFFRTIVFSRKRFILTKAFSKTLLKKRNWKLSKAFLSQRKRNWHFTNAFLTELKRFRNLSKASQTKLKIVDCVFSDSYYNVAFKLSEAFLSRKRFRFKCVFFSITFANNSLEEQRYQKYYSGGARYFAARLFFGMLVISRVFGDLKFHAGHKF